MRSRRQLRYFAITEGCLAVAAVVVGLALGAPQASSAEPVKASITRCDLSTQGSAQVTYTVTNADRVTHGYRVELAVATDTAPLGWGISLVNRVEPGATATAHAMLPVTGSQTEARCTARARTNDGRSGHHG
ncbi:hypothetical protein [Micromonospora sp. NPDC005806]|uniref:hypothetical protein n=1 Tax=Micromonospora sp. NPDC005806 TaxID=3364234 RepID=UPI0036BCDEB3